jgi:sporulation protein YlmC with PRC-barrel domain
MAPNRPLHVNTAVFKQQEPPNNESFSTGSRWNVDRRHCRVGTAADRLTSIPGNSRTVTDWYKQNVYDQNDQKLGEIMDLLVNQSGQIDAAMVGVGGFLGAGEKDVAVNFNAIKPTKKNDKTYLTLNTTKDALNKAPGFKYDKQSTTWVPDNRASNEKRSSR